MAVLHTVSGNDIKNMKDKYNHHGQMKSSLSAKVGRGAAGPKPSSSRASSQSSLGYSVESNQEGAALDYATIAQLKAVAGALQPSRPGQQQSKNKKASFAEQKRA